MDIVVIAAAVWMFLFIAALLLIYGRIFRLWLQCTMSGAPVSAMNLMMMQMRRTPMRLICEQRIKAKFAGVDLDTADLEKAYLQGGDIEKMVDALLLARRTNRDVTWDQLHAAEFD